MTDLAQKEKVEAEEPAFEIEIVDDRPEEDRRGDPLEDISLEGSAVDDDGDMADDDEMASYGNRVQKRISKLKYDFHEQRRARDKAERLAREAVTHSKRLQSEYDQMKEYIQTTNQALISQTTERAKNAVAMGQRALQDAHESGDAQAIAKAQQDLINANLALANAPMVPQRVAQHFRAQHKEIPEEGASSREGQGSPPSDVPEPDPKAQAWYEKNSWFGEDPEMTSLAYGIHEKLVTSGVDPTSDDYYNSLDKRMREVFPDRFTASSSANSPKKRVASIVAPVTRSSGGKPTKVVLTATQVALARKLGITNEQYAAQLLKMESENV